MALSKEFTDQLIEGWLKHQIMAAVVAKHVWGDDFKSRTAEEWREAMKRCGLEDYVNLKTAVTVWVANNFRKANDHLWNGNIEMVKKWIASGKDYSLRRCSPATEAVKEMKKHEKGVMRISVRNRDKNHDWKTVK